MAHQKPLVPNSDPVLSTLLLGLRNATARAPPCRGPVLTAINQRVRAVCKRYDVGEEECSLNVISAGMLAPDSALLETGVTFWAQVGSTSAAAMPWRRPRDAVSGAVLDSTDSELLLKRAAEVEKRFTLPGLKVPSGLKVDHFPHLVDAVLRSIVLRIDPHGFCFAVVTPGGLQIVPAVDHTALRKALAELLPDMPAKDRGRYVVLLWTANGLKLLVSGAPQLIRFAEGNAGTGSSPDVAEARQLRQRAREGVPRHQPAPPRQPAPRAPERSL